MDIDLLGRTSNGPAALTVFIQDVCRQSVAPDGLEFDVESVAAQTIAEEADYEGVRLRFRGNLGTAKITTQIDVGFGDVITPQPALVDYPTLLGDPAPRVLAYPRESAVAEKFQVMLHRAQLNSGLRDCCDIWLLSRSFAFQGELLASAIQKTCERRGTEIPVEPIALTVAFAEDPAKQTQWAAYRRKSQLEQALQELSEVVQAVAGFLGLIVRALGSRQRFDGAWQPPGRWTSS